jgi:Flp pilus assembly protein TadD
MALEYASIASVVFFSNAIKANPNSSEAHFCLAHTAQKEENFEMAITHFESALTLNSQDCGAFNNLGNCYDRLEKTTEAIEAYSKAIVCWLRCIRIFLISTCIVSSLQMNQSV